MTQALHATLDQLYGSATGFARNTQGRYETTGLHIPTYTRAVTELRAEMWEGRLGLHLGAQRHSVGRSHIAMLGRAGLEHYLARSRDQM